MSLRKLKWLTMAVLVGLVALFLVGQRTIWHTALTYTWRGYAVEMAIVTTGVYLSSTVVFRILQQLQARILQQNHQLVLLNQEKERDSQQLRGLHRASLALTGERTLESLLQRIVDLSRDISEAQYAALIAVVEDGKVQTFLTSGLSNEERARAGDLPQGQGIFGLLLKEARPLRLEDLTQHPAAVGFPPGHPPMTSFLGIPIVYKGKTLGGIYLANKLRAREFTQRDQETLEMFASQAAVALENVRLNQDIRTVAIVSERELIAREMHDSLAQVLGYVSTKTQGIQEMVRRGNTSAALEHLEQMKDTARRAYADVREGILALRSTGTHGRGVLASVRDYAEQFSRQSGVPTEVKVEGDEEVWHLNPLAEVQMLRIVQEALTNVRKHARATKALVHFSANAELRVRIEDDGQGFNPLRIPRDEWPHLGLQTMQERAEAIAATLHLESSPGQGTTV
ncbi:MAG: hypothetical protein HW388_1027, partial [Dehalococcoidia bacterium]|nr:hypothetical protein [Dehalococcoidia bacterium]